MTLLRLGAAWLAVTVLFVAAAWASGDRDRRSATVAAVEAGVVALLAALWFGSLGHGGWLPVFLLLGLLASGSERWRAPAGRGPSRTLRLRATIATTIRYILSGLLLALLLG